MKRKRTNLYKRGKSWVYRHRDGGKDHWATIGPVTEREALKQIEEIRQAQTMVKLGLGERKRILDRFSIVGEILDLFEKAGYPKRDGSLRGKNCNANYKHYTKCLRQGIGKCFIEDFNASVWNEYTAQSIKAGRGTVALDHEIILLRTAWKYATEFPDTTGLKDTPSFAWYRKLKWKVDVVHCRERQPDNAEQLHEMAAYFLRQKAEYATVGWFVLVQAMIGCRRSELLKLRLDAKSQQQPGYDDGEHLWLYRSKTHKGTASFIKIHPALRSGLRTHRNWIELAFPGNLWFFPSRVLKHSKGVLAAQSVNRGIKRLKRDTGIDKSTHGLRSFYVNVRQSQGGPDAQIALEVGHKSPQQIVETYGEVLPIKLDWIPKGTPAWEQWQETKPIVRATFG